MREYLEYTQKNAKDAVIIALVGLAFCVCGVLALHSSRLIGLILILLGIVAVISAATQKAGNRRAIERLKASGEAEQILNDFATAEAVTEDAKLGKRYIFRRKYTEPILLLDVVKAVYAEKTGDGAGETNAGIYLTLKNGREERMCGIYGPGQRETARRLLAQLNAQNPWIAIE